MQRCLDLAKNGLGTTYPNPLVGSVIVCDGEIIGEGWHQKAGKSHAEVNAINSVKDKKKLLKATLYVNLEPCSHYGKTPPCANLIVKMKIPKVVIGTMDYNSSVYGKGIAHLKENGCTVEVGVLEKECLILNKRFFTFHQKKRPYIILKWAETKDGYIFPKQKGQEKQPIWISNAYALQLVHKWRAEEQSILVGRRTVINDNPKLNVRTYFGESPIRIAIDRKSKIPKQYNFLDGSIKTIVFSENPTERDIKNTIFQKIDFSEKVVKQVVDFLYANDVQSLLVEGGAKTLEYFIESDLWDEARVFVSENNFLDGIKAPRIKADKIKELAIGNNKLTFFLNKNSKTFI